VTRILITGSRRWTNAAAISEAIEGYLRTIGAWDEWDGVPTDDVVIIHGAASGADRLAHEWALRHGLLTERYPARWEECAPTCRPTHRKSRRADGAPYCPTAGHRRNQKMIDVGADVCLAFPIGTAWSGTRDCMRRAEAAGIPVASFEQMGV
jgi:hypothetical protein